MANASFSKSTCDDCGYNEGPEIAKLDNNRIEEPVCEDFYTPTLDFDEGCDQATVQLQSKGQGYLRAKGTLRAAIGVAEPLTVSKDGKKIELNKLPWPAVIGEDGSPVPADSLSSTDGEANNIGYWSDRPGDHPLIEVGKISWPVDGNGDPIEESAAFDPEVGTFQGREGHPIVHTPKVEADCVYSQIWNFNTGTSGSLPVSPSNPMEIPFINTNCSCQLIVQANILFTYTLSTFQTSNSASEINLALKGHATSSVISPIQWTFRQTKTGEERNAVYTGNASVILKVDPKSSTSLRAWPEFALGTGEASQPQQFNLNSCVEVCYTASLSCQPIASAIAS